MRRRNPSGPHHSNGGGNRPQHGGGQNRPRRYNNNSGGGSNRSYNADGQDSGNVTRTRRHATVQREKYYNMARDMLSGGDRVQAEYYFQHVEHYTRVLNELPPEDVRPQQNRYNNNYRDPQGAEGNNGNAQNGDGQQQQQPNQNAAPQQQDNNQQQTGGNGNTYSSERDHPEEAHDAPRPAPSALPAFITGGVSRPRAQGQQVPTRSEEE